MGMVLVRPTSALPRNIVVAVRALFSSTNKDRDLPTINSKRYFRRSCQFKTRYRTPEEAVLAAVKARSRISEEIVAYECVFCGHHHIGHPGARRMKSLAEEVTMVGAEPAKSDPAPQVRE
jgi:hypothetical protein